MAKLTYAEIYLHMPGWPEMRFHGVAKTDGLIWWWEDLRPDGSKLSRCLQPYDYVADRQSP